MFYTYILYSPKSKDFYYGWTKNLNQRFKQHNEGLVKATKPYSPWELVWYGAFQTVELAKEFEDYLKSGSGKALAYKRLLNTVALKKDKWG
jgi:predicted GIY-YIG superfamily endonuclease